MKNITRLFTILILIGLLAACGSDQPAANSDTAGKQDPGSSSDPSPVSEGTDDFETPLQTKLIIGTFRLEGTENEVTAEQAVELLPLWMVLKNLLESDTAAAEEIDALTTQIANAMTEAQMEQINNLEFGPDSSRNLMIELGLTQEFLQSETDGESGSVTRPEGMPGGTGQGMGAGGGQGAGSMGLSPEQIESVQATREAGGGRMGSRMGNTQLIEALVELLQSK